MIAWLLDGVKKSKSPPPLSLQYDPDKIRLRFYLVTNAGRAERDMAWLKLNVEEWNANNKDQVSMEILSGWGLIALQGEYCLISLSLSLLANTTS